MLRRFSRIAAWPIWANNLSTDQIRGIGRLANAVRDEGRTLTPGGLIDHVREWNDTQPARLRPGHAEPLSLERRQDRRHEIMRCPRGSLLVREAIDHLDQRLITKRLGEALYA
jgi:hypothetical protein